ncbi:MAG: tetratricopeptide repeat protein [Acidobacteria bacterium]|nr:tetratricopeptide repeat protein [Acidobacteriota bacterium]
MIGPRRRAQTDRAWTAAATSRTTPANVGNLGMVYQAGLLPHEALRAYAVAQSLDPGDWRWPYHRGLVLVERGDQIGAGEAFRTVTAAFPAWGLVRFHLAEIAFKAGRPADAEAACLAAEAAPILQSVAPDDGPPPRPMPLAAHASFGIARLHLDRGEIQAARKRLAALVAAHPEFGSAQSLLLRLDAQRPAGAMDDGRAYLPPADPWLDALVARSWHPDLLLKHAAIAGRGGDTAWRQWLVRRALTASPNSLDVLLEAAATERAANRLAEALRFRQQAEIVAPDDHHTLFEQGRTLSDLGRLPEAEAVLRRAVRVRDAAAEYNLASVLDRMERWDEAREHYDRALAINPFHSRALNNLGIGFSRHGDRRRAFSYYRRAIDIAPEVADSYTNLSAALGVTGRFLEALAATDMAVKLNPSAADAHGNRGIALAQLGRRVEARAAFETAIRIDPRHADAKRNLAALGSNYY